MFGFFSRNCCRSLFVATGFFGWKLVECIHLPTHFANNPISSIATNNLPASEMNALSDLYYSTNGTFWNYNRAFSGAHWNFTKDINSENISYFTCNPCRDNWAGLVCNNDCSDNKFYPCQVIVLRLADFNLSGTIPFSINNLTALEYISLEQNELYGSLPALHFVQLQYLDMYHNYITGFIPASIFDMTQLYYLNLEMNNLFGDFSSFNFTRMNHLSYLSLGFNNFNGSISNNQFNSTVLAYLSLQDNMLRGTLPEELGNNLPLMEYLSIGRNQFTGTIPDSIGSMISMHFLNLGNCLFTGTIPQTFDLLHKLTFLNIQSNYLSGSVSNNYLQLWSEMHDFHISNNQFTGLVPFPESESLFYYEVSYNYFTGSLPKNLFDRIYLNYFDASFNSIHGSIPNNVKSVNMQNFAINCNLVTNTIPDSIGSLTLLIDLFLFNNLLSGTMPNSLSELHILESMYVQNNLLSGSIYKFLNSSNPIEFEKLHNISGYNVTSYQVLSSLDFSGNQFTGQIPSAVFKLPRLTSFAAMANCLSGSLPSSICNATQFTTLSLDGLGAAPQCQNKIIPNSELITAFVLNKPIEGGIPLCLLSLNNLITLQLSGNGLSGTLPYNLTLGSNLFDLTLSHNKLSGPIPLSIQTRNWNTLDLAYNKFNGQLLSSFAAGNGISLNVNRLSGIVPHNLTVATNISMLTGNIFECNYDKNTLPKNDDNYANYSCGSNSFYASVFSWIGAFLFWVYIFIAVIRSKKISTMNNSILKWYTFCTNDMPFGAVCSAVRRIALWITVTIILLIMPVLTTLSALYKTYDHLYGWSVSAMFLSGYTSSITLLVVFSSFLIFIMYNLLNLKMPSIEKSEKVYNQNDNIQSQSQFLWQLVIFWLCILPAVVINCSAMLAVNIGYVYATINYSSSTVTVVQIILAIFKLVWNEYAVKYLLSMSVHGVHKMFTKWFQLTWPVALTNLQNNVALRTFTLMFNNILTPCVTFLVISPVCFNNLFIPPPPVQTTFSVCFGSLGTENTRCTASGLLTTFSIASFVPPFTYSYQCSSTFVQNYAAMYVYMFMIIAFVDPVVFIGVKWLYDNTNKSIGAVGSQLHRISGNLVQRILQELPESINVVSGSSSSNSSSKEYVYFSKSKFSLNIIMQIAILLTFGVIFPPLSIMICVAIFSYTYYAQLTVGRLLCMADSHKDRETIRNIIASECTGIPLQLSKAYWYLIMFASCFYAAFLFDILGDVNGAANAVWIGVVMVFMPLVLRGVFLVFNFISKSRNNDNSSGSRGSSSAVVQMTTLRTVNSISDNQGCNESDMENEADVFSPL